jgi:parallel beta-helix repeat protein
MSRKLVFFTILIVLISMLDIESNVQRVGANGTIYIRAGGSIAPQEAPISTIDNVTYTFTGNIHVGVVIERDNVVIDGAGHSIKGTSAYDTYGISISGRSNITIKNIEIEAFWCGIELVHSSKSIICGNTVAGHYDGIVLVSSSNNIICGNAIAGNYDDGIWLESSSNNSIDGNRIYGSSVTTHDYGITLHESSYNRVYGNVITDIEYGIGIEYSTNNNVTGNTITMANQYGIWFLRSSNNSIYHNNFVNNTIQFYLYESVNVWDDDYPSGGNYWSDYTGIDADGDGIGDNPYIIDANNRDRYPFMTEYIIAELPSLLILPLFIMATLLAVIIHRRKQCQLL